jgi:hypothetical protein
VEVQYTKGGTPVVLVPDDILEGSGLCRDITRGKASSGSGSSSGEKGSRQYMTTPIATVTVVFIGILVSLLT